jgi:hypothetical protein
MMEVFERQEPSSAICGNPHNLWMKMCLSAGFLEQRMQRYMAGYIRRTPTWYVRCRDSGARA